MEQRSSAAAITYQAFRVAYCGLKIITSLRSVSLIFSDCYYLVVIEPLKAL
jgi:hypothetical protein